MTMLENLRGTRKVPASVVIISRGIARAKYARHAKATQP